MANDFEIVLSAKDDVSRAIQSILTQLGALNTKLGGSDKELTQFEKSLANAASKAGLLATAVGTSVAPMNKAQQALAAYNKTIADFEAKAPKMNAAGRMYASKGGGFISQAEINTVADAKVKFDALSKSQALMAETQKGLAKRDLANHINQQVAATKALATSTNEAKTATGLFGAAWDNVPPASTRYALYDVSNTLLILGAALTAGQIAAVGFAATYERAFADVQRTVNDLDTPKQMQELNQDLMDLAATIPVTFQELSHIASMGGQLGIAGEGIDEFTETVAKLSTVAEGLTFDKAATALGRFKAILGVSEGEFDNLASSILAVGVNSVATEAQIVNITTQIASMAGFAGFTADQVVGLSGALASVGAPPELSRGVVTRLFAKMSESVAESGLSLDRFAQIAGVSAEEFESSWGNEKFAGIFQKFMGGLAREGGNAVNTLHELGITSVRDVPLLMRLAGAADANGKAFGLLDQTMQDAKKGWEENTELARQYDLIAGTFLERIKVLGNNFANLAAIIGGPLLSALKPTLDAFVGFVGFLGDIAQTPVGGFIMVTVTAIAALSGALLLFGGIASRAFAALIGLQQASNGVFGSFTATRVAIANMNAQLLLTTGTASRAGVALRGVGSAAIAALGPLGLLAGALIFAPEIAAGFDDIIRGITGVSNEFDDMKKSFLDEDLFGGTNIAQMDAGFQSIGRSLGDIANRGFGNIKRMDEELAKMVQDGNAIEAGRQYSDMLDDFKAGGGDVEAFNALFVDTSRALVDFVPGAKTAGEAIADMGDEVDPTVKKLEDLQKTVEDGALKFVNTGTLMEQNQQRQIDAAKARAEAEAGSAEVAENAWQKYYDGSKINLQAYLDDLQTQVDAQANWKKNLETLGERGVSDEILADLAKLGPEGVPLVQALVDGSAEELARYKELWRQSGRDSAEAYAIGLVATQFVMTNAMKSLGKDSQIQFLQALNSGMPLQEALKKWDLDAAGNPIDIKANAKPAYDTAAQYLRWVRQQSAAMTITVDVEVRRNALAGLTDQSGRPINVGQFASGGYTGDGGKYQAAGVVHRGEFVMTKEATDRIGVKNLYAMMRGSSKASSNTRSYAGGGHVGGGGTSVVELSPYDRMLLSRNGNPELYIDGEPVGRAVGRAATNSSIRGRQ